MKKTLLMLAVVMTAMQLQAAPVDLSTAQSKAKQFVLNQVSSGRMKAPGTIDPQLVLTETGKTNVMKPVYYIFNTDQNFIIVAGDDRAEEILAVGDRPLNVDRIPVNMKSLLNTYREQIDYLLSNPDIRVEKPLKANVVLNATTVEPLLTALWDQDAPYYNQCYIGGYQCLTGCPATSAAMVFYYWKFPTDPTPVVPAFKTNLNYSYWSSTPVNVPALPSVTFDWDNMLDRYRNVNYTTEQGEAVATLMRYVGQAERMDYGTYAAGGSGVDADSVVNIANAFTFFGYDETTVRVVKKTSAYTGGRTLYTDEEWAAMIQEELAEERPIVYCAISNEGGHAFNVDGYNANSNLYHVNYGWSGDGNGDFALNAFRDGSGVFNQYQQMVIGIQPPPQGPAVKVGKRNISMECYAGESTTATFTVKGHELTDLVSITVTDDQGAFTVDPAQVDVTAEDQQQEVTVTFAPQHHGEYSAVITLTSGEAHEAVVKLEGVAHLRKGELLLVDPDQVGDSTFRAQWTDASPQGNVASYSLMVQKAGYVYAEEVAKADFAALTNTGLQADAMTDFDDYCSPEGWTGQEVYADKGGVRLGYSSSNPEGALTTPLLDLSHSGGKLTITFKAKSYGGGTDKASLVINSGDHSFTQKLKSTAATYTVVVDCEEFDGETVTFTSKDKRVFIYNIAITTTDVSSGHSFAQAPAEQGDAMSRTITGITDLYYTVAGLTPGATYGYKVRAHYIDGTSSRWTKTASVTLTGAAELVGDIDGNGSVGIEDVNAVINVMLGTAEYASADVDGNGSVGIEDVNAVINIMLGK